MHDGIIPYMYSRIRSSIQWYYHTLPNAFFLILGLFSPLPLLVILWCIGLYRLVKTNQYQWIINHPMILGFTIYALILALINHSLMGMVLSLGMGLFLLWTIRIINEIHQVNDGLNHTLSLIGYFSLIPAIYSLLGIPKIERMIYQWLCQSFNVGFNLDLTPLDRMMGTFFHPNYYACICVLVILALLVRLIVLTIPTPEKIITMALILINLFMLYQTGSRTGLIIGIITMGSLIIMHHPKVLILVIPLLLILMVQPSLIMDIIPRMHNVFYAINDRYQLWSEGIHNFLSHPWFGQGFYTLANQWYLYGSNYNVHAHSLIIELLECFGLFGIGFIMIALVKPFIHRIKHPNQSITLMLIILIYTLFSGLIDVTILFPQTFVLTTLLLLV